MSALEMRHLGTSAATQNVSEQFYISTIIILILLADVDYVMRPPYTKISVMSKDLERRLAIYFSQVLGRRVAEVSNHLSLSTLSVGKFRIRHGGDSFRTETVSKRSGQNERKNCYVRVRKFSFIDMHASSQCLSSMRSCNTAEASVSPHP